MSSASRVRFLAEKAYLQWQNVPLIDIHLGSFTHETQTFTKLLLNTVPKDYLRKIDLLLGWWESMTKTVLFENDIILVGKLVFSVQARLIIIFSNFLTHKQFSGSSEIVTKLHVPSVNKRTTALNLPWSDLREDELDLEAVGSNCERRESNGDWDWGDSILLTMPPMRPAPWHSCSNTPA